MKNRLLRRPPILPLVAVLLLLAIPWLTSAYVTRVWIIAFISCVMGISLSMSIAVAGVVSLGQAGFYAIGAYTAAILGTRLGVGFPYTMLIAGLLAAAAGGVLAAPAVRLRGMYFMLTTLAFGEVVRLLALNWTSLTRGPIGITGIPGISFGGQELSVTGYYLAALALAGLALVACEYVAASDYGLLCRSMRDDDLAAAICGMNVPLLRTTAASLACFWAGAAGAFYAHMYSFVSPTPFNTGLSLSLLVISMLGALLGPLLASKHRFIGTAVAAISLTWLLEGLRFVQEYRMAFYGLAMVLLVVMQPRFGGLVKSIRRQLAGRGVGRDAAD